MNDGFQQQFSSLIVRETIQELPLIAKQSLDPQLIRAHKLE